MHNAIRTALAHHHAGQLPQAEAIYRKILQQQPDHPDALYLLGLIADQTGNTTIAIELYRETLNIKPDYAEAHQRLGLALKHQGKLDEAIACYRNALAFEPGSVDAYHNLGLALAIQGKLDEAAESYRNALIFKPDSVETLSNLGIVLRDQGKLDEAVENYQQTLALKPDSAETCCNLGSALREQGKLDEAVTSFRNALTIQPDYADAYNNLGVTLQDQGKLDEAISSFYQALKFKPDFAEAHINLGGARQNQGMLDEAVASYHNALAFKPNSALTYYNLGSVLREQSKLDEAVASYHNALAIKPDYADAYNNLAVTLKDQGKLDEAVAAYYQALKFKPDYATAYSNLLFASGYHALLEAQQYLDLARGWELACVPEQARLEARSRAFQRPAPLGRRLRVGYVSGDFRQHPVSYFVEQLFKHHDKNRIELFAYTTTARRDAVTERLQALAEHWVPLTGGNETNARARIEADAIDVLIDLSGHTEHNRLRVFAERAAPVQAHYLGYFASTGLTEMDYWIGDERLTPPDADNHYSEQVWRLPRVWVNYEGKAEAPLPNWKPASDGSVWLGSFNHLGKLTPVTLALWAKVLHALPEARLLLKTKQLSDPGNRRRIADAMEQHGIAVERIELQDISITPDWTAHMAYHNRLDLALDPIGAVGGGTTTCDALWMSVPVVTLQGDRMASRMTASMLQAIDHPEWITSSEAEYIDTVVALARNVTLRQELRLTQRERMAQSPLCDAKSLACHLENAYLEMFQRWLNAQH
jgi:protein O-GlcNAc transferase